jgi:hypothetical protein
MRFVATLMKTKAVTLSFGLEGQLRRWTGHNVGGSTPDSRPRHSADVTIASSEPHDAARAEPGRQMMFASFILESLRQSAQEEDPQNRSRAFSRPDAAHPPEVPAAEQRVVTKGRAVAAAAVVGLAIAGTLMIAQLDRSPRFGDPPSSVTVLLPPATTPDKTGVPTRAPADRFLDPVSLSAGSNRPVAIRGSRSAAANPILRSSPVQSATAQSP